MNFKTVSVEKYTYLRDTYFANAGANEDVEKYTEKKLKGLVYMSMEKERPKS